MPSYRPLLWLFLHLWYCFCINWCATVLFCIFYCTFPIGFGTLLSCTIVGLFFAGRSILCDATLETCLRGVQLFRICCRQVYWSFFLGCHPLCTIKLSYGWAYSDFRYPSICPPLALRCAMSPHFYIGSSLMWAVGLHSHICAVHSGGL